MEKVTEACKNFWNWVKGAEKIEVSETDLVDLANYIQNLGYGLRELLSCIPIIGNISNALEDSIRNTKYINNPDQYGMIHFDSTNEDWWNSIDDFSASIDRDNNRLTIKTGTLVTSQMNWDLTGWTGRYGKPIELSLALHLSTMAPDFVYVLY